MSLDKEQDKNLEYLLEYIKECNSKIDVNENDLKDFIEHSRLINKKSNKIIRNIKSRKQSIQI